MCCSIWVLGTEEEYVLLPTNVAMLAGKICYESSSELAERQIQTPPILTWMTYLFIC